MSNLSKILLSSIILNFSFSINYIEDIQPIFNASCTNCHSAASSNYSNHQLDLTSYSGVIAGGESGDIVIPFDASSSLLWENVTQDLMPPYGSGIDFLTEEQTNLISDWIDDGALEEEEESDDGGDDGAPECMLDCEGIDTVDPDVDANAFCEWFMPTYDNTSCMDDCEYDYDLMIDQIYSMCQLCLIDNSCDEMWNSDDCSDLDQSDCEDNADCNWNDYDMMCEDSSDDGPPECWLDCEGSEVLYQDMTGTELCTWFVPVYEDGSCLGDCDSDELFMNSMIYSMCSGCLQDDSCDEMFDENNCSDLDQSECEENGDCEWNDYDMMCEDSSDDGPPPCLEDCPGIWDVDPEDDATAFCNWYIPTYDDGSCMGDCGDDYNSELNEIYSMCQICLVYGNCDGMWDDLEVCADLDQSECEENGDCEWNNYDMICEDTGDLDNELIVQSEYKISSVYPNPFNPTTTITYQVPHFSSISIDVYNINGQLIENLYKGYKNPGEYAINWNAGNVTSGVYLIKLISGSFIETQRVMLVK